MITDEERREVAKRLRGLDVAITSHDTLEKATDKLMKAIYGERPFLPVRYSVRNLCGLGYVLADLIDPQTTPYICENVYDENECGACRNGFKCSVCGVTVEDCEGYYVNGTWNYCPKCRRKVVKGGH